MNILSFLLTSTQNFHTEIKRWNEYLKLPFNQHAKLVKSCQNRADNLTRVSQMWLDLHKKGGKLMLESCAAVTSKLTKFRVADIHQKSGYPGVKRTLYFARIINPTVSKELVKSVVRACEACQSIDPAPVRWEKGDLSVKKNWNRLAMDMIHYPIYQPLRSERIWHKVNFLKLSLTGLNSEFSFS